MISDLIRVTDHPSLRPCPFCGNRSLLLARDTSGRVTAAIFCPICEIVSVGRPCATVTEAVDLVAAAWNRRAKVTA